jgi:hypothetical protein
MFSIGNEVCDRCGGPVRVIACYREPGRHRQDPGSTAPQRTGDTGSAIAGATDQSATVNIASFRREATTPCWWNSFAPGSYPDAGCGRTIPRYWSRWEALAEGIPIEPGDVHFLGLDQPSRYFRPGYSSIPVERIEPGIRKLAEIIERP